MFEKKKKINLDKEDFDLVVQSLKNLQERIDKMDEAKDETKKAPVNAATSTPLLNPQDYIFQCTPTFILTNVNDPVEFKSMQDNTPAFMEEFKILCLKYRVGKVEGVFLHKI